MKISEELLKMLEKLANEVTMDEENSNICDYAAGNLDDAYSKGFDEGQTWLSRDILVMLGLGSYRGN